MSQQPQSVDPSSEYDVTRLLHLARLLTSDTTFLATDAQSTTSILNLQLAPKCDVSQSELDVNAYFSLYTSLTSENPTYAGQDPIGNITLTIRQLASCQSTTKESFLSKIGDFFMRKDGGKHLREILLASKVIVECLALWYSLEQNNLIDGQTVQEMQQFCQEAVNARSVNNVDAARFPRAVSKNLNQARQWNGNLTTVVSTFSLGTNNPTPILLIFNEGALQMVMNATENSGNLPPQAEQQGGGSSTDTIPMTFVPRSMMKQFVEQYIQSGAVKPAQ